MGSWRFIIIQTGIVAAWLDANIVLLSRPFDPFPFILLNLAFWPSAPRLPMPRRSSCWQAIEPHSATG